MSGILHAKIDAKNDENLMEIVKKLHQKIEPAKFAPKIEIFGDFWSFLVDLGVPRGVKNR